MNILVVASYLPFPIHSGGDVRLYNILTRLAKKHTITLVAEKRSFQTKKDVDKLEEICKRVITFPRKKQWSIGNVGKSGFSAHSFLITGHTLPEMKIKIDELLDTEKFDLIHVETSYVMQNIPETKIPIVLTEHNIEHMVYQRYADQSPFFLKPFLNIDIQKLQKEEIAFWKKSSRVVAVSEKEKAVMQKAGVQADIVPNGVDLKVFGLKNGKEIFQKKEKRILFIGDYKWIQNQSAARWILSEIWPKIEEATEEHIKLWLVGRNMGEDIKRAASSRVIIEGVSERPAQDIFSDSFILLSPLKVAGGTQYKILESMAVGTPVVTTPLGIEGLGLKKEGIVLTAGRSDELAKEVLSLLGDEKRYMEIAENGRKHVEEHFSFDSIAERLDKVYHEVVQK